MAEIKFDRVTLVGQVGQVTVILKPIKDVAHDHAYSHSYIKRLCQEQKLIATKWHGKWYVEEHLSETKSLTTLQDTG